MEPDPSRTRYRRELEEAVACAREAGGILRDELHRPSGPRGRGGHSPADEEAEAAIRRRLGAAFPDHGTRGEELGALDRPSSDAGRHVWLIDPNDGTRAFIEGHRGSAVSIALLRSGRPVVGVVYAFAAPDDAGDLIAWAEGGPVERNGTAVRRSFAGSLDLRDTSVHRIPCRVIARVSLPTCPAVPDGRGPPPSRSRDASRV